MGGSQGPPKQPLACLPVLGNLFKQRPSWFPPEFYPPSRHPTVFSSLNQTHNDLQEKHLEAGMESWGLSQLQYTNPNNQDATTDYPESHWKQKGFDRHDGRRWLSTRITPCDYSCPVDITSISPRTSVDSFAKRLSEAFSGHNAAVRSMQLDPEWNLFAVDYQTICEICHEFMH